MISFIIPFYNEAGNLSQLHAQITAMAKGAGITAYQIMFIDDGSTDGSSTEAVHLATTDQHTNLIALRTNFGKSAAMETGFRHTTGDIVITMDADLQDDPQEVPFFLAKLDEGYDLVSGWKKIRHDPLSKTIPSRFFNLVTAKASGISIHDFNCGFKAYRREVIDSITVYGHLHRYLPVLAHNQGFKVAEVAVRHHPRQRGVSKFGMERYMHGFLDLLTVLYITKFTQRPLHLFGSIGTVLGGAGLAICLYITSLRVLYGSILERKPLLLLGILLIVVGVQFVSMGLIGEMIAYYHQKDKSYPIKEQI